jgi:Putative zinc-finger
MVVNCEQVWREVSDYLDGEMDAALRSAMEQHIRGCKRCTALLEGTRNVIQLYGDERMLQAPLGFSSRLRHRLEENARPTRRGFMGWLVAAAAAILVTGSFEAARSANFRRPLRSAQARPSNHIPPDLLVVVYPEGKTFHVRGCPYILDKTHLESMFAHQAEQEGYAPCVRCMKKYLS